MALLSEEPFGLVPTRTPGAVSFEASLTWKSGQEADQGRMLPALPQSVKVFAGESEEVDGLRRISCEVRAFDEGDLQGALDVILHYITSKAALFEAVLEIKCVRRAHPYVIPREILEQLAHGLWNSGCKVEFGTCWTPLYGEEDAAVGVRGAEDAYALIKDLHPWQLAPYTR